MRDDLDQDALYIDTLDGSNNLLIDLNKLEGKHLKDFSIDNLTT